MGPTTTSTVSEVAGADFGDPLFVLQGRAVPSWSIWSMTSDLSTDESVRRCATASSGAPVDCELVNMVNDCWSVNRLVGSVYGRVMRDGVPVPGTMPPAVLSQLAYRVFGPLRPDQVRTVLDYHGLIGRPAGTRLVVADRHGITPPTLTRWSRTLAQAGSRLPLTAELATEISRRTRPGEDHLARTRIATTLGLATPAAAPRSLATRRSQADHAAAAIAVRVLATVGPLPQHALHHGIARARRFRSLPPIRTGQLAAALIHVGATSDDRGRWHAPADSRAPDRYRALVAVAAGRDLTRAEMVDALLAAEYAPTSANARKISTHPLIQHCGTNRYRVLGPGVPDRSERGAANAPRP